MRNSQLSKNIFYAIVGLPLVYLLSLIISIILSEPPFSDFIGYFIYLFLGISVSLILSFIYFEKLRTKSIEIKNKIVIVILLQIPSTIIFMFCNIAVFLSRMDID